MQRQKKQRASSTLRHSISLNSRYGSERKHGSSVDSFHDESDTDQRRSSSKVVQQPAVIKEEENENGGTVQLPMRSKSDRLAKHWLLGRFQSRATNANADSCTFNVPALSTNSQDIPKQNGTSAALPATATSQTPQQFSNLDTVHQVARAGDVAELEQILQRLQLLPKRGDKSGRAKQQLLNTLDETGSAPLHYAARYHHTDAVRLLLAAGANVNVKAEDGQTPLHYACRYKAKSTSGGGFTTATSGFGGRKSVISSAGVENGSAPAEQGTLPRIVASLADAKTAAEPANALASLAKAVDRKRNFRGRASTFSAAFKQTAEAQQQQKVVQQREPTKKQSLIDILRQAGAHMNEQDHFGNTPLHVAVMRCNAGTVRELLSSHADSIRLQIVDESQQTALHVAAGATTAGPEANQIAHLLLRSDPTGSQLRHADANKKTPLHLAAAANNVQALRMILHHAQNKFGDEFLFNYIHAVDEKNQTPLLLAADCGHLKVAEQLLKHGALVNVNNNDSNLLCDTALHLAANRGDVDMCELLVAGGGAHVDARNLRMHTPLHRAAAMNRVGVTTYLTRTGADVEARDQNAWTPLLLAARNGHTEIIRLLVDKAGANIYAISKRDRNALYLAASSNHVSCVRTLLGSAWGYELLFRHDRYGLLPIHIACKKGHCEVVRIMLITLHNDNIVDERLEDDKTTLHLAAQYGWQSLLQLLIQHKLENLTASEKLSSFVEYEDENGDTPLHAAALNGHYSACLTLLRTGANVAPRSVNQWSPLHNAASRGHAHVCELLLAHEAPLDQMDKNRTTPLHVAAMMGHLQCVVLLTRHGAAVHVRDVQGRNALDFAIDNGHRHVAMYFVTKLPRWRDAMRNEQFVVGSTEVTAEDGDDDRRLYRNTPMRKLIRTMPDVAYAALSMCMDTSIPQGVAVNDANFKIICHTDFIEDTFLGWAQSTSNDDCDTLSSEQHTSTTDAVETMNSMSRNFLFNATDASGGIDYLRAERHDATRAVQRMRPYSEDKFVLEQNHPVLLMVRYKREELLKHPLTTYFIDQKWAVFGRPAFFSTLFLYGMFLMLLTGFTLNSRPVNRLFDVQIDVADQSYDVYWAELCPRNFSTNHSTVLWPLTWDVTKLNDDFKAVCEAIENYHENGNCSMQMLYDLRTSAAFTIFYSVGQYVLPLMSVAMLVKEACQSLALQTLNNKLRWLVHIFTITITIPWREGVNSCANTYGLMSSWEWQLAAFNLLLAWIQFVVLLRNFPWLGLYVQFLQDVLRTVLRFLPVCLLVLAAFALGFYNTFQALSETNSYPHFIEQAYVNRDFQLNPFWSGFSAIINTVTMFGGEYSMGDIFSNLNQPVVSVLYMLFVFFCSIIMVKVMVGLAVDDINMMLEQAELKRIAMRVEFMLTLRRLMPIAMRSKLRQTHEDEEFYPNKTTNQNGNHSVARRGMRHAVLRCKLVTNIRRTLCEYGIIGGVTITVADVLRARAQLEQQQQQLDAATNYGYNDRHSQHDMKAGHIGTEDIEKADSTSKSEFIMPTEQSTSSGVQNGAALADKDETLQKLLSTLSSLSPAQMQTFVARLQRNQLVLTHIDEQIESFRQAIIAQLTQ